MTPGGGKQRPKSDEDSGAKDGHPGRSWTGKESGGGGKIRKTRSSRRLSTNNDGGSGMRQASRRQLGGSDEKQQAPQRSGSSRYERLLDLKISTWKGQFIGFA